MGDDTALFLGKGVCGGQPRFGSGSPGRSLLVPPSPSPRAPFYSWLHLACIFQSGKVGEASTERTLQTGRRERRTMARSGLQSAPTPLGRAAAHPGFSVRPPKVAFCQRFSGRRLGRGSPEERKGGVSWGRGLAERAGGPGRSGGGGGPAPGPGGGGARSLRQRGCVWWERKSLCCRPIALGAEAGEGAPLPHSQPPPPLRAKFTLD